MTSSLSRNTTPTRQRRFLSLVTEPGNTAVKVDAFKTFGRLTNSNVSADDSKQHIEMYLNIATDLVQKFLGRVLITQTWELTMDEYPTEPLSCFTKGEVGIQVPLAPLISVTDPIVIYNSDGTVQDSLLIADRDYEVSTRADPGRIIFHRNPGPGKAMDGIKITFVAGYGTTSADVPEAIRLGIMMWALKMYKSRTPHSALNKKKPGSAFTMPSDVAEILAEYRVYLQ